MEKIACVRPEGRPSRTVSRVMSLSGISVRRLMCTTSVILSSRHMHSTAEIACAITVASATPAAAMPKLATNTMSRKMFSTHATIRNSNGVMESPMPRRMPEMML